MRRTQGMAYYSVAGSRPWKNDGEIQAHPSPPKYRREEVAKICLECQEKRCTNEKGCKRYQEAISQVVGGRVGYIAKKPPHARWITVNGVTKNISEWARTLGVTYSSIKNYASYHGLTIEQEIERRMKERAEHGNGNDTP